MENEESFSSLGTGKASPSCSVTSSLSGKIKIVSLKGEIDLDCASRVYSLILAEIDNGELRFLLDLKELDFMDSSGLQILLRLKEKQNKLKKEILIVNPSNHIVKLFQLTGFDKLFRIFNDTAEALSWLEDQA